MVKLSMNLENIKSEWHDGEFETVTAKHLDNKATSITLDDLSRFTQDIPNTVQSGDADEICWNTPFQI